MAGMHQFTGRDGRSGGLPDAESQLGVGVWGESSEWNLVSPRERQGLGHSPLREAAVRNRPLRRTIPYFGFCGRGS